MLTASGNLVEGSRVTSATGRVEPSAEWTAAVRAEHVGITFSATRALEPFIAVKDVSFTIEPNELVCMVGPSGCGKSSLLMALAGLIDISTGSMTIGSRPITGPSRERAVVFQSASLLPWRTVLTNVRYPLDLLHVNRAEANRRSMEMINLVGLKDFERRYPHELSGGMQQRVNLARALNADPSLLLMDEPFAALDSQTREDMQIELLRIWSELKKSVLFVTHQIDEAVYLADRVVVLTKGPASRVAKVIDVNFERPRPDSIRLSPQFTAIVEDIWMSIRG
jgi:NitT/TauT family transport system ATP-binding protein